MKKTKASVTNFLHCGDDYLFIKRHTRHSVMPGQVNGIGGKVDDGEDYITTAIRETEEETGYKISEEDIKFNGLIKFVNKGGSDWFTCFYKIAVPHTDIPIGNKVEEGELVWFHKDEILNDEHLWADDLNYIFEDILNEKKIFFLTAEVEDDHFKIVKETSRRITR